MPRTVWEVRDFDKVCKGQAAKSLHNKINQ